MMADQQETSEVETANNGNVLAALVRIEGRLTGIERSLVDVTAFKDGIAQEVKQIRKELNVMKENSLRLEIYTRRDNLLFHNVPEADSEDLVTVVKALARDKMNLGIWDALQFEWVHRLGKKRLPPGKPRPILARFLRYEDRMEMLKNSKSLAGHPIFIGVDYPKEMQNRRKRLVPVMSEMKRKGHTRCYIRARGTDFVLFVDGRPHTSASDLEGDSQEARDLRAQYDITAATQPTSGRDSRSMTDEEQAIGGRASITMMDVQQAPDRLDRVDVLNELQTIDTPRTTHERPRGMGRRQLFGSPQSGYGNNASPRSPSETNAPIGAY